MSNSKYKRFIRGLEEYNLTFEQIQYMGAEYCGGNKGRYKKYWNQYWKEKCPNQSVPDLPALSDSCVCGHHIVCQHYITFKEDGEDFIMVLGSECIKRFMPNGMKKSCNNCGKVHKNRKKNVCNDCQKICKCGKPKKKYSDKCNICMNSYECEKCQQLHINTHINRCDMCRKGVCDSCNETIKEEYSKCYNCRFSNKCNQCGNKCKPNYLTCFNCSPWAPVARV
jgi:hypothetical protein